MTRTLLTVLAVAGLTACGGGERRDVATADSLSRDLQLAPVDTSAVLNDQPAADTAPAAEEAAPAPTPAPAPPKPAPKPKPAAPKPAAPAPAPAPAPAYDARFHASHHGGSGPFVPVWATLGMM
ncbi:MAG: hypothetical protein ACREM9_12545, partial [Gemmatimonadales bacterium]